MRRYDEASQDRMFCILAKEIFPELGHLQYEQLFEGIAFLNNCFPHHVG